MKMKPVGGIGPARFSVELAESVGRRIGYPPDVKHRDVAERFFDVAWELMREHMRSPDGSELPADRSFSAVYSLWRGFLGDDPADCQTTAYETGREARRLYESRPMEAA